jgi:peptidoglycan/xylan/chitin deacetylase (PgdA/CDA1 family)
MTQYNNLEITKWKNNSTAALTLVFDDCFKDTMKSCMQYLATNKIRSTWGVPTAYVSETFEGMDIASWSDLCVIAEQSGMEIASHSVNHLLLHLSPKEHIPIILLNLYHTDYKLDYIKQCIGEVFQLIFSNKKAASHSKIMHSEDIEYEVTASKREIEKHMKRQDISSYIYPYGRYNEYYKDCLRAAGYESAKYYHSGNNTYEKLDFFKLRTMTWNNHTTLRKANEWVRKAIKKNAWLIETFHLVGETNPSDYEYFTHVDIFLQHMDYLVSLTKDNKIWIDTQQRVCNYVKEKLSSKLAVTHQDNKCIIVELLSDSNYKPGIELTLKIEIPEQLHIVRVSQGSQVIPIKQDNNFILFNVLPDNRNIVIESI